MIVPPQSRCAGSLCTLPKKAGNISLTLREWGLFCIESLLRGAGGVCYTYGMEESNTHYNKERRLTLMKKLARLTALLLTGVMLLVLTACGAETEQQAKQRLLDEINSYRATLELDPLVEVKQLSEAEQALIAPFRDAGKTKLSSSEGVEASKKWLSMTADWTCCDDFGLDSEVGGFTILAAKVPANTPEGKTELWTALRGSNTFDNEVCTSIGIAVVTIDGQMYWSCYMYN